MSIKAKIEESGLKGDEYLRLVVGRDAIPILEEEIPAIRDACEEWLEQESQRIMKESIN